MGIREWRERDKKKGKEGRGTRERRKEKKGEEGYKIPCLHFFVSLPALISNSNFSIIAAFYRYLCYGKSVHLSVRPSVRHTPVLYQNKGT